MDLQRVLLPTLVISNVIFLFCSLSSQSYAQTTADWKTYNNPTHGIKISHPNDWQLDIEQVVDIPGDYITTIAALYPASEATEAEEFIPTYVEIGIDESVKPISVPQYLDDVINSYNSR